MHTVFGISGQLCRQRGGTRESFLLRLLDPNID